MKHKKPTLKKGFTGSDKQSSDNLAHLPTPKLGNSKTSNSHPTGGK